MAYVLSLPVMSYARVCLLHACELWLVVSWVNKTTNYVLRLLCVNIDWPCCQGGLGRRHEKELCALALMTVLVPTQ